MVAAILPGHRRGGEQVEQWRFFDGYAEECREEQRLMNQENPLQMTGRASLLEQHGCPLLPTPRRTRHAAAFMRLRHRPVDLPALTAEDAFLTQVTFKNTGVLRREMQFEDQTQPCDYMELAKVWSTPWNAHVFPYLCLVQSNNGSRQLVPPPSGMRSAVPLGGLGGGTVELRADGSFHDSDIFNNSPDSVAGKVQLNDAFFGLRVKAEGNAAKAWTLRTHPPL